MSAPGEPLVPAEFRFGVATSGFQVEGGFNGPGEPANNWLGWERMGRVEPSGLACDVWAHPEPALDRAAACGADLFRLSVEWARLEPAEGRRDDTALARYAELLAACTDRGLEPVVTLHHFTHPAWLGEEFWLRPGSPDRFAEHVAAVVPALVPWCRRWVTVNEPNVLALAGWVLGLFPPGRAGAVSDALCVMDNLLTAHVLAADAVRAVQPEATVTTNNGCASVYEFDRLWTDLLLARSRGVDRGAVDDWLGERRRLHDRAWPARSAAELALRRAARRGSAYGPAPARRAGPRRALAAVWASPQARPLDVVGLDWYDPEVADRGWWPGRRTAGGRWWAPGRPLWEDPPRPAALTRWCRDQHALIPDLPLWVMENGVCSRVVKGRAYPRGDGWDRPRYLRAHLGAVVDAVAAGVPLEAYLYWSLADNYEWGSFEPRFGLHGLDRDRGGGVRWLDTDAEGRDSAAAYRQLIAAARQGDRGALRA
jgi:beta-glucosidase/6-phospho-beta-glucosidase/beta-galactosidase